MPKLLLKIILGLAAVVGLLLLAVWFRDQTGVTTIVMNGYEVSMRTSALIGLLIASFALIWFAVYFARRFFFGMIWAATFFDRQRYRMGLKSLSGAMLALAEGDGRRALRLAQKAERLLDNRDLTNLINAQAAVKAGELTLAERYFEKMSADRDTAFIGAQGLLAQALHENQPERALKLAERAHALRPRQGDVLDTLFELQRNRGDWAAARGTVAAMARAKRLPRDVADRRIAVLHLADAEAHLGRGETLTALREAMAAVRMSPGLVPAAAMAARLLTAENEKPTAKSVLLRAWRATPHPDLAAAFAGIEASETPDERFRRFGKIFEIKATQAHEETRLLKAELAIAAGAFEEARDALGDLAETTPSARACALMAAIEQAQSAGETIVRGWLSKAAAAPRGPQWVCERCGDVSPVWRHTCPACGAFDTLSWRRVGAGDGAEDAALFPLLTGHANGNGAPKPNGAAIAGATPKQPALPQAAV